MINRFTFSGQTITSNHLYGTTYEKSINSADDLQVGGAYSAKVTFITDISTLEVGDEFTYAVSVDGINYTDISVFHITAITKSQTKYTIEAYDSIQKLDCIVDEYLQGLTWPVTLYNMYTGLLTYAGLQTDDASIVNGTYSIPEGSFTYQNMSGRQLLSYISQLAGGFAECKGNGKITISTFTDSGIEITSCKSFLPSDDNAAVIDKVKISYNSDDVGISYGSGNEVINIVGNPLTFNGTGLDVVAQNIYDIVNDYDYRPFTMNCFNDVLLSAGSIIEYNDEYLYIFSIEINANGTIIKSTGNVTRNVEEVLGGDYNIYANDVRYNTFKRTLDGTISTVANISDSVETLTTISQNAYNISLEAQSGINNLGKALSVEPDAVKVYNLTNDVRDESNYLSMTGNGIDIIADGSSKLSLNQDGVQAQGELKAQQGLSVNDYKWITSNGYLVLQYIGE